MIVWFVSKTDSCVLTNEEDIDLQFKLLWSSKSFRNLIKAIQPSIWIQIVGRFSQAGLLQQRCWKCCTALKPYVHQYYYRAIKPLITTIEKKYLVAEIRPHALSLVHFISVIDFTDARDHLATQFLDNAHQRSACIMKQNSLNDINVVGYLSIKFNTSRRDSKTLVAALIDTALVRLLRQVVL